MTEDKKTKNSMVKKAKPSVDIEATMSDDLSVAAATNKKANSEKLSSGKRVTDQVVLDESILVRSHNKIIKSSVRKLNLVAQLIRGVKASEAASRLSFCSKKAAYDVRKVLMSGVANAEHNHNMDIDALYVKEAYVGKAMVLKRFSARARGRGNRINKEFSKITIVLCAANN